MQSAAESSMTVSPLGALRRTYSAMRGYADSMQRPPGLLMSMSLRVVICFPGMAPYESLAVMMAQKTEMARKEKMTARKAMNFPMCVVGRIGTSAGGGGGGGGLDNVPLARLTDQMTEGDG